MESTPGSASPPKIIHAVLGRRDEPTDGVADFCHFLQKGLASRNVELQIAHLPWFEKGWPQALAWLRNKSMEWRGEWALLQYTALAWSRRGFPVGARRAARILEANGARLGVIFHDAVTFKSTRLVQTARLGFQHTIMRNLYRRSERSILTVPPDSVDWLPPNPSRAIYIPIGANIPEFLDDRAARSGEVPTAAVFSITGGKAGLIEIADIALATRRARERLGALRLEVFGRGAENARVPLERALEGSGVALRLRGVLPAEEITRTLASSDVLLCVRGYTTSRRGTAIAGIACGMPVIGYGGPDVDPAIDAAGVRLSPWRNPDALADSLVQVLSDAKLRQELHRKSVKAQRDFFSWRAVADRYVNALGLE